MDEVRELVGGRIGRKMPAGVFGLLALLLAFGSVAAACVTHTTNGGNHHDVVSTCIATACPDPPDLVGNANSGSVPDPFGVGFDADSGSRVVSTVQLAMTKGGTCVPLLVTALCTTPTPGQDAEYDIRSAPNLTQCSNNTGTTVVSSGNVGRNFVAEWTVPTTTGNYTACVALPNMVPAFDETYVHYTVF